MHLLKRGRSRHAIEVSTLSHSFLICCSNSADVSPDRAFIACIAAKPAPTRPQAPRASFVFRAQEAPTAPQEARFVPRGEQLDRQAFRSELPADKCRVIREFVADIFDMHITEALKVNQPLTLAQTEQKIQKTYTFRLYSVDLASHAGKFSCVISLFVTPVPASGLVPRPGIFCESLTG